LLEENRVPPQELPRIRANMEQYEKILSHMKEQFEKQQADMMKMNPQRVQENPEPDVKKKKKYKQRK